MPDTELRLAQTPLQSHPHLPPLRWPSARSAALTEDLIVELAEILADAYERYQQIRQVPEEHRQEAENGLDTGRPPSPHGQ